MIALAHPNRTLRHPNDPAPAGGAAEEYAIAPEEITEAAAAEKRSLAVARLKAAEQFVAEQFRPPRRLRVAPQFVVFLAIDAVATLALGWNLPQGYLAAGCGVTALAWILLAWMFRFESAYVEWTWWGMLTVYAVAVLRAALFDS